VRRLLTPNKEIVFEKALAGISADEMGRSRYKFSGPGGAEGCSGPDYLAYSLHDKTNKCTKINIFYCICWFVFVNARM
jgi:hypothetical protein